MKKYDMTYHAQVDRLDRLSLCIETVGVGDILKQRIDQERQTITQVTSTGLILVVGLKSGKLITGFMGTVSQVAYLYQGHTPTSLMKVVKKNNKLYPYLLEMQEVNSYE